MASPFHTYAGLLERSKHLIHLYLRNDPQVVGYQFWGAGSANDAYGNPAGSGVGGGGSVPLFEVARGQTFRSLTIRRRGMDLIEESRRGTTHAVLNIEDFGAPDHQWTFIQVQENRVGVGLISALGAVFCVLPAKSMGVPRPTFTLVGTAPSAVVGVAAGQAPPFDEDLTSVAPRPLYLVFPFLLSEFTVQNTDAVKTLLVSFGPAQLMQAIPPGAEAKLLASTTKGLILACPDAGGCPYSIHGVMRRG